MEFIMIISRITGADLVPTFVLPSASIISHETLPHWRLSQQSTQPRNTGMAGIRFGELHRENM